jgi:exodeoxyribonuclease VIII
MVDLETLGTKPGSLILSIGATTFGRGASGSKFHAVIKRQTALDAGLTEDAATVAWWAKQSPEARKTLDLATAGGTMTLALGDALCDFSTWLYNECHDHKERRVWGNGASFDNVLIHGAYRACGFYPAWDYTGDRCYRTLKALRPDIRMNRTGTHHNALDDAVSQAQHAFDILEGMGYGW